MTSLKILYGSHKLVQIVNRLYLIAKFGLSGVREEIEGNSFQYDHIFKIKNCRRNNSSNFV